MTCDSARMVTPRMSLKPAGFSRFFDIENLIGFTNLNHGWDMLTVRQRCTFPFIV